jgi:hypothetical protein
MADSSKAKAAIIKARVVTNFPFWSNTPLSISLAKSKGVAITSTESIMTVKMKIEICF